MRKWWAFLALSTLLTVGCIPLGGTGDDGSQPTPTPDLANDPGACVLGSAYDGETLPANFPTTQMGVTVGSSVSDFSSCLANSKGTDYHLYAYLGQVVLLNMGAGWCPPCQGEAPDIQQLYADFKGDGFVVLMTMGHGWSNPSSPSQAFLDQWSGQYGIEFPVVADPSFSAQQYYLPAEFGAIPLNVLIDRDGVVRYNAVGSINVSAMRSLISTYVNTPTTLEFAQE